MTQARGAPVLVSLPDDVAGFWKGLADLLVSSVTEMNEALIAKWNAGVGKGDLVYHLGDFAWGDWGPYGRPQNENFLG
jgi:hypothetical protein